MPQEMTFNLESGEQHVFTGQIHFGNFNRNTIIFNRKIGYYPIAVTAMCTYPDDHTSRFYKVIFYFDLNTHQCRSNLVFAKVHTSFPAGVY